MVAHGQTFFGSGDKLRNSVWGYRIYLASGVSSYNPNLKVSQHAALGFPDLGKTSLRTVGMNLPWNEPSGGPERPSGEVSIHL